MLSAIKFIEQAHSFLYMKKRSSFVLLKDTETITYASSLGVKSERFLLYSVDPSASDTFNYISKVDADDLKGVLANAYPEYYYKEGKNVLYFDGKPAEDLTISLGYYGFTDLSNASVDLDILTDFPQLVLPQTLIQLSIHTRDDKLRDRAISLFERNMTAAVLADVNAQSSDTHEFMQYGWEVNSGSPKGLR